MKLLLRSSLPEPVVALDDVSLDVFPGEVRVILGANGAGKSTLFRILTGLTTPTTGSASIKGLDATRQSTAVRKLVGFMPADTKTLLLRHSPRENLVFHGRLQGIPESRLAARVEETLETVGIAGAADRVCFALSSGMLARLLLARAILHEPVVLILDEPTGAVDPIGSYELLGLVQQVAREQGLAVLISSHRLDEVEMLNDKVLLLDKGKIVFSGDLGTMVLQSIRPRVEIRLSEQTIALSVAHSLENLADIHDVAVDGDVITLSSELSIGRIVNALNGQEDGILSIGSSRPRLRDVLGILIGSDQPGDRP
jgi:ABC-2 type transport system ATP-binding protein